MFKESNPILQWNRRISNAQLPSFFSLPVSAGATSQAAIRTGSSCPSSSSSPSSTTGLVAPRVPQPSEEACGLEGESQKSKATEQKETLATALEREIRQFGDETFNKKKYNLFRINL